MLFVIFFLARTKRQRQGQEKFNNRELQLQITSYHLILLLSTLHIFMHNIILPIYIYLC